MKKMVFTINLRRNDFEFYAFNIFSSLWRHTRLHITFWTRSQLYDKNTHLLIFCRVSIFHQKKKFNLNKARLNRCPIIRELFVGIHAFLTTYHNSLNSIFLPQNTTFLIWANIRADGVPCSVLACLVAGPSEFPRSCSSLFRFTIVSKCSLKSRRLWQNSSVRTCHGKIRFWFSFEISQNIR